MRKKHEDTTNPPADIAETSVTYTLARLEELAGMIGHYFDDDEIEILSIDELDSSASGNPINDDPQERDSTDNVIPFPRQK